MRAGLIVLMILILTATSAAACDLCGGPDRCCGLPNEVFCPATEFWCYSDHSGSGVYPCTLTGDCPHSGCGGFSCGGFMSSSEPLKIVKVEIEFEPAQTVENSPMVATEIPGR